MASTTQGEASSSSEPSGVKLALTLGVAGLLSGLALVGTYEATLPTITANKAAALQKAAFDAVPASRQMQGASLHTLTVEGRPRRYHGVDVLLRLHLKVYQEGARLGHGLLDSRHHLFPGLSIQGWYAIRLGYLVEIGAGVRLGHIALAL